MKNTFKNIILFSLSILLFNQSLIAQEGSVGIGTTTPTNGKLEVQASTGQQALYVNSVGDNKTLRLRKDNGNFGARLNFGDSQYSWLSEDADDVLTLHSGSGLIFSTSGQTVNERMRISSSGNVGIGTSNPNIDLAIGDTDTGLQQQGDGELAVYTNNVERARFNSSGNLGIGTSSPSQRLDVVGSAKISSRLFLGNNPSTAGTGAPLQVGISTDDQSAALFRNNSPFNPGSAATIQVENEGNGIAIWSLNSDCRKPNGGEWVATSDRRLKQDIVEFTDGLEQVRKIRPVTYRYNDKTEYNTEEVHIGIIAQELQEIAPYMVKDKEEYLAIDGSAFKYMLINAVQEQDQIITDQQKEIDELKARLDRIEALLNK